MKIRLIFFLFSVRMNGFLSLLTLLALMPAIVYRKFDLSLVQKPSISTWWLPHFFWVLSFHYWPDSNLEQKQISIPKETLEIWLWISSMAASSTPHFWDKIWNCWLSGNKGCLLLKWIQEICTDSYQDGSIQYETPYVIHFNFLNLLIDTAQYWFQIFNSQITRRMIREWLSSLIRSLL